MNIFFLDTNPEKAARALHNTHVVKMITESAQLLTNVHYSANDDFCNFDDYVFYRSEPFKKTHYNHPCSIWARTSADNYSWLLSYIFYLCDEFEARRGKKHKCEEMMNYFSHNMVNLPSLGLTAVPLCMPSEYQDENDVVQSYRAYYLGEKWQDTNGNRMDKWTYRNPPIWWTSPESRGLI